MIEYTKGVVVDYQGYFVAALQWETGTPAPDFKRRKSAKRSDELKVQLLTSDAAVEGVSADGRWNGEGWDLPTEERWIVQTRKDLPDFAFLIGSRKVWPERLPKVPAGQSFVSVAPPYLDGAMPSWKISTGEWVFPKAKALIDDQGEVFNIILSLDPADTPVLAGGSIVEDFEQHTGEDEAGEISPLGIGDKVVLDQGAITSVIKKARKFPRHSLRIVKRVLQARGQLQSFLDFATAAGVTAEDLEDLGDIGLNTKLFRDWLASEGFTVKQAYQVIEAEIEAEKARIDALKSAQELG